MSRIEYDPIKDRFAGIIRHRPFLRTVFYKILDLFFLRSWYVRRIVKKHGRDFENKGEWKLLDAGCGFGQYDRFILSHFDNVCVTSVDVKEDYLNDCRLYFDEAIKNKRINFARADLLELEPNDTFNFVICIDVLEHIEKDETVIKNLQHALKQDGYFLMHSPSVYSEEDAGEEDSFVGEHARTGYSKQQIKKKIENAGLTPLNVEYTYGPPGHFAWKLLIKYPMLWMNKISLWAVPVMAIWYIFTLLPGLILMWLDIFNNNEKGTGIYALAKKGKG